MANYTLFERTWSEIPGFATPRFGEVAVVKSARSKFGDTWMPWEVLVVGGGSAENVQGGRFWSMKAACLFAESLAEQPFPRDYLLNDDDGEDDDDQR